METIGYDYKKILTHILLIFLAVTGFWGFFRNWDWVMAPSRQGDMKPVMATVLDKWEKSQGGGKGTSYTLHVLELASREGCYCKGSAQVSPWVYGQVNTGDQVEALCLDQTCFHADDRRWKDGYRIQLWLYLLTGLLFGGIEAFQLFRYYQRRK
ncbi:MAG: hypothetical protein KKA60_05490 [Proteobacteria bacterium]|nr:hypothetical protein [Pseudomonadota bacterium]